MKLDKRVVIVLAQHIEKGIAKYHGEINSPLQKLITDAGYKYTPYIFNDGRILLVLPKRTSAFLYPNEQTVLKVLNLE